MVPTERDRLTTCKHKASGHGAHFFSHKNFLPKRQQEYIFRQVKYQTAVKTKQKKKEKKRTRVSEGHDKAGVWSSTLGSSTVGEIQNSSWVKVNTSPVRVIHAPMTHPIALFPGFICPFVVVPHSFHLHPCVPVCLPQSRWGQSQEGPEV